MFSIVLLLNFTVKHIHWKAFSLALFALILVFSAPLPFALASSKSPYDSGYDHGCDDAGISDPSDQYINQPEKGPAYHTSEFMDGYYSGLNSCGSNYAEDSYEQPQQAQQDRYYYEQPQQAQQKKGSLGDDLGQLVECAGKAAPFASATGPIGTVVGGIGCGIYAAEKENE